MVIYLLCLMTKGGIPIFTRRSDPCDNLQLPFPTIASLNGAHMFFKSLGMSLLTTYCTDDWIYVWKDYHKSLTLIVCGREQTEESLKLIAEYVFCTFSLFIRKEDYAHIYAVEQLKREAKKFMPLIDEILTHGGDYQLNRFTECVLAEGNTHLLQQLKEFSAQSGTLFCSLVTHNKTLVATEGWWNLHTVERYLLLKLLKISRSGQNDVAVYLPKINPKVAYRFVTIPIAGDCAICLICGSELSYCYLNTLAQQIFRPELVALQGVKQALPRNLPDSFEFESLIQGLIFLNVFTMKMVTCKSVQKFSGTLPRSMNTMSRSATITRNHYKFLKKFFNDALHARDKCVSPTVDKVVELGSQYWCSDYFKCCAISDEWGNILFLIFEPSTPVHTMMFIGERALPCMLQDKTVCWYNTS